MLADPAGHWSKCLRRLTLSVVDDAQRSPSVERAKVLCEEEFASGLVE